MGKFIIKHIKTMKPSRKVLDVVKVDENKVDERKKEKKIINEKENTTVMTTNEKIEKAQEVLNSNTITPTVKRIKKDKGLIERTESSKTILTEDNKELLKD